jgi:hypothetical protein
MLRTDAITYMASDVPMDSVGFFGVFVHVMSQLSLRSQKTDAKIEEKG